MYCKSENYKLDGQNIKIYGQLISSIPIQK